MSIRFQLGKIYKNRYRSECSLGKGGSAIVIGVIDTVDLKKKAIKLFKSKESAKESFDLEMKALKKLKGLEGIPLILDDFKENGSLGIVFERMAYDLDILKTNSPRGALDQKTVLCLTSHMVNILESVHKKNVVHRDIKAMNVMLRYDHLAHSNPIQIIDWALSMNVTNRKKANDKDKIFGKYWLCTPSMRRGEIASKRDDMMMVVYVALELLGNDPFCEEENDDNLNEAMKKKELFEKSPQQYTNDGWIIQLVHAITSTKPDKNPDYNRVKKVLTNAKRGFVPATHKLQVAERNGAVYLK